jgi:hypothetical protein
VHDTFRHVSPWLHVIRIGARAQYGDCPFGVQMQGREGAAAHPSLSINVFGRYLRIGKSRAAARLAMFW